MEDLLPNSFEIFHLNDNRFSCQRLMLFKATIAKAMASKQEKKSMCERYISKFTPDLLLLYFEYEMSPMGSHV